MNRHIYIIDGNNFSTLDEFWDEISKRLIPGAYWGRNLDAFNDILRGGFGTPEEGFTLIWKNSKLSRERLSYNETINQLEKKMQVCHPSWRVQVKNQIENARRGEGPTVFDWLINIITSDNHKDIELRLE